MKFSSSGLVLITLLLIVLFIVIYLFVISPILASCPNNFLLSITRFLHIDCLGQAF